MQIGAADRAARHLDDGIARVLDARVGNIVAANVFWVVPAQGFQGFSGPRGLIEQSFRPLLVRFVFRFCRLLVRNWGGPLVAGEPGWCETPRACTRLRWRTEENRMPNAGKVSRDVPNGRHEEQELPSAGPHAKPSLMNPDATPGAGALPPRPLLEFSIASRRSPSGLR